MQNRASFKYKKLKGAFFMKNSVEKYLTFAMAYFIIYAVAKVR
jgi:hypothetical protein